MDLRSEKTRLERRLQAIEWLETLDDDQLEAVREALKPKRTAPSRRGASDKRTVRCRVCGNFFQPSGIRRHITRMHAGVSHDEAIETFG